MKPHPAGRTLTAPRTRGLALAGAALTLLTMFCLQLTTSNQAAWRTVLAPGPASLDQALGAICGSLALAITLWLFSALLLSMLAALGSQSSALGATLGRGARLLAPRILRNAVAALLGVTVVATPSIAVGAGNPLSSPSAPAPVRSSHGSSLDDGLSPSWIQAMSGEQIESRTAATSPALREDLTPGWVPPHPSEVGTVPDSTASASASAPTAAVAHPNGQAPHPSEPAAHPNVPERAAHLKEPESTAGSASPARPTRRTQAEPDHEIVVRRGDTLWGLAERHLGPGATAAEIAVEWPHWFTANRAVIGNDPDHLVPGERLRPPERNARTRTRATASSRAPSRRADRTGTRTGALGATTDSSTKVQTRGTR